MTLTKATKAWSAARTRVGVLSACWLVFAHALDAWSAGHGMLLTVIGVLLFAFSTIAAHRLGVTFDALSKAESAEAEQVAREREAVLATLREPTQERAASTEGVDPPRVRVAAPPEVLPTIRLVVHGVYAADVNGKTYMKVTEWPSEGRWKRANRTGQIYDAVTDGSPLHALLERAWKKHVDDQAAEVREEEQLCKPLEQRR